MKKRKICIITGTRAEYGLLHWLMNDIKKDPSLELQIIATGMHCSTEFGLTHSEIENDGFNINKKIEMIVSADTPQSIVPFLTASKISNAGKISPAPKCSIKSLPLEAISM